MLPHAHQAPRRCPMSVPTAPSKYPAWSMCSMCSLRPAWWGCRKAYSGGLTGWLSRLEKDQISGGPALFPHQHPIPQGTPQAPSDPTQPSQTELHPLKLLFHPCQAPLLPIGCGVSFFSHWGPFHTTLQLLSKGFFQSPLSGTSQGSPGCTEWDNGT